jgi:hypothetical protein
VIVTTSAGSASRSDLAFGVSYYSEITLVTSSHDFGTLTPGETDQPILTPASGYISVDWIANNVTELQVEGSGDLQGPAAHTIPLGQVVANGASGVGSALSLTTSFADLASGTGLTPPTDETVPVSNPVYLWITVPAVQFPGLYTYTLYVQAVKNGS